MPETVTLKKQPGCPKCQESLRRIPREPWMRSWPLSRHYTCTACRKSYLSVLGFLFARR